MSDLTTHVLANPRGREYSYAVRVRGLPYLWTDGRATWSFPDAREVIPALAKTDFTFDFKVDPREPLDVGSGISISLIDEPSRRTRNMFSPELKGRTTYLTGTSSPGVSPTATGFTLADSTGWSAGDEMFLGLETVTIDSTGPIVVTRGAYGSLPRRHVFYTDGATASERGIEVTQYPTVMAGRYVDVYMAPIESNGAAGTRWTIWAGRLGSVRMTGRTIRLSVDPLTSAITKDEWPTAYTGGQTNSDQVMIWIANSERQLYFDPSIESGSAISTGNYVELGLYSTGGTFNALAEDADGGAWYSLPQIASILTDSLIEGIARIGTTVNYEFMVNNLSFSAVQEEGKWLLIVTNATPNRITISGDLVSKLRSIATFKRDLVGWTLDDNWRGVTLAEFNPTGYVFDESMENNLQFYPRNASQVLDPDLFGFYNATETEMHGYAKVSGGDNIELVSYSAAAIDTFGNEVLGLEDRGLVGTRRQSFGTGDNLGNVNIDPVCMIRTGAPMDASDVLLYMLLSQDGATSVNHATYDKLGSAFALGIHNEYIDIDGIRSRMRMGDMPKPAAFWCENGKGKESLAEFCKAHGIYLITKRFERSGEYLFGISVDLVDVPVSTRYNVELNDSHVLADTIPEVDINERILINNIKITPRYEFDKNASDTGGVRYVTAGDSIAKYGRTKEFAITANAWFNIYSSLYGGTYNQEEAITAAIATHVALRWFGAYSDGNYTAEISTPHVGWAFQAGDRVSLDVTGGVSPNGNDGLSGVAKIMDIKHVHGSRAGCELTLRINTTRAAELAPCIEITAHSAGVLTIAANEFTDTFASRPFYGQTGSLRDGHFFDRDQHGADFNIQVWEEGNFANRQTLTITASNISGGTITTNDTVGAPILAVLGSGVRLLATVTAFGSTATTLSNSYVHIGTSATRSLLDDGGAAETEAYEWI